MANNSRKNIILKKVVIQFVRLTSWRFEVCVFSVFQYFQYELLEVQCVRCGYDLTFKNETVKIILPITPELPYLRCVQFQNLYVFF